MICQNCGQALPSDAVSCEQCNTVISEIVEEDTADMSQTQDTRAEKPEKWLAGSAGAFLGAVIGGISILLLGQLGMISAISGVVLAFCTLRGYVLFAGRLSKKGILISLIFMLVMPYLADRISWAIEIIQTFEGVSFGQAFAGVHALIEKLEIQAEYWKNLLFIYAFVAVGSFTTIKQALKNN